MIKAAFMSMTEYAILGSDSGGFVIFDKCY